MPAATTYVPPDPLERFVAIFEALEVGRGWWQSADQLRHSALMLASTPGEPRELAARLTAAAKELERAQPWYRRSSVGTLLAAQLVRTGRTVASLLDERERAGALFRERWRWSGGDGETLAILTLADASPDGRVSTASVARLAGIYAALERDHPMLTNKSDWPLCALLALRPGEPDSIGRAVEQAYQALRAQGFGRGDDLQTAAGVLVVQGGSPGESAPRFRAIYDAFDASGLWMGRGDYDEVALLCFASETPEQVVATVERHRRRIGELSPKPGKPTSFSLAAGTAQLELARDAAASGRIAHADAVLRVVSVLAAQRAAAAAAAASAAT